MTSQNDTRNRCEHCDKVLHPDREVFLSYDRESDTFSALSDESAEECFPFGKACAKTVLKNGGKMVRK